MVCTKGEAETGDYIEAVRHIQTVIAEIVHASKLSDTELQVLAKMYGLLLIFSGGQPKIGRLSFVNFAAGCIATPADAALIMHLGCGDVLLDLASSNLECAKRTRAIVQPFTHYRHAKLLAKEARIAEKQWSG